MISSNIKSLSDKEDRDYDRRAQQEELRKAAGLPEPVYHWKEPNPDLDHFGNPKRKPRRSRTST
jgi:hypothetical protein